MSDTLEQAKEAQQRHLAYLRQRVSNLYAEWSELREYEAGLKYLEAEEAFDQLLAAVRAEAQREAFIAGWDVLDALAAGADACQAVPVMAARDVDPQTALGDCPACGLSMPHGPAGCIRTLRKWQAQLTPKETPDGEASPVHDGSFVDGVSGAGLGAESTSSAVVQALTPDAALLEEADKAVSYALSPQHSGHALSWLVRDLDQALRASLDREREMQKEMERLTAVWLASPEAAKRFEGYRELGAKCAELEARAEQAERERDEYAARLADLRAEFDARTASLAAELQRLKEGHSWETIYLTPLAVWVHNLLIGG